MRTRGAATMLKTGAERSTVATSKKPRRVPTSEEPSLRALLDRVVREGINPNAEAIAEIASRGEIAIVVLEPSDGWRDALGLHGWNRERVFAMSERVGRALSCADPVTENWVVNPRSNAIRIFAVIRDASLLVNSDVGGFCIEPGSTDESTPN